MRIVFAAAAALLFTASSAQAQDRDPCPAGQVCASSPGTVVAAMTKAGLKPRLTSDSVGDPMIQSDEATYRFAVYFYGCENHVHCDSLRFEVLFAAAPENTPDLANKWNSTQRFLQAAIKPDGRMVLAYDIGTIGGFNDRNFADVLDWWTSKLQELGTFFQETLEPAAPAHDRPAG